MGSTDYTEITYHADSSSHSHRDSRVSIGGMDDSAMSARSSHAPAPRRGIAGMMQRREASDVDSDQDLSHSETHPPLLEIPEEVYAVRKSALQVLKPLTRTWVSGKTANGSIEPMLMK